MALGTSREIALADRPTHNPFSNIAPTEQGGTGASQANRTENSHRSSSTADEDTARCRACLSRSNTDIQTNISGCLANLLAIKVYNPRRIEVPEQLVMDQEGKYYILDLGYTRIILSEQEVGSDGNLTLWQRLAMCTFPCCIKGPGAAWRAFVEERAFFTFIFITSIVHVVVFAIGVAVHGFDNMRNNPLVGPSACALYHMGAKWTPDIVVRGQVWRLAAPIWLHGGAVHLALNLLAQLSVGFQCEYAWGSVGVALVFLASGLGGNLLSALGSPASLSVGASGAILGLVGGHVTHTWLTWSRTDSKLRAARLRGLVVTLVLLVGTGLLAPVDNWAHCGGLVSGALVGCALFRSEVVGSGWKRWLAQSVGLFGLLLAAFFAALLFLHQRQDYPLDWC